MSVDVDGTIPPAYMHKEAKDQVIGFLRAMPTLPSIRRRLLLNWARIVGATLTPEEIAYVQVLKR